MGTFDDGPRPRLAIASPAMKKTALVITLLGLSACTEESGIPPSPEGNEAMPSKEAAAPPAAPAAEARAVEEKTDLLEFTYGWPAEAAAIPALEARLKAELESDHAETLAAAGEDKEARGEEFPFHHHYFHKKWESYGSSPRLLSLAAAVETFTGGAHGNTVFDSILWDRQAGRAIEANDLFGDPAAALAAMSQTYCGALDRRRAEKRQVSLPLEGDDWMTECPTLGEQVIVPVDGDGNGRFDTLRVLIPPYEAGPYAEGSYEVDIPVTDAVRGRIKEEYRGAF
jgi:hypothetical protein